MISLFRMNRLSGNRKIIKILGNLEDDRQNYPPELMHARRKKFAKQMLSLCTAKQIDNQPNLNHTTAYDHVYRRAKTKRQQRKLIGANTKT